VYRILFTFIFIFLSSHALSKDDIVGEIELMRFINLYEPSGKNNEQIVLLRKKLFEIQEQIFPDSGQIVIGSTNAFEKGFTNLHYYILSGDFNNFIKLFDQADESLREKLLWFACSFGEFGFVEFLVENKVSLNTYDRFGSNLLFVTLGKIKESLYLIDKGVDINHLSNHGYGVLELIIIDEQYNYLNKLLDADVNIKRERTTKLEEIIGQIKDKKLSDKLLKKLAW